MPIPRMIEIYKNKAFSGDDGTDTFALKRNDQILEYIVKVRAKNGATANAPDGVIMPTIEEALSKIEVKSGGAVFKSYTGEMCRKIAAYRNGQLPHTLHTQAAGGTWAGNDDPSLGWMEYTFPINFNLPNDPYGYRSNVMLPAPLYDSLDLVIDYDFEISSTAGFLTGGANHLIDVYALVMPKESKSAMMDKRIIVEQNKQDYTSVVSGEENFGLTTDANRFLRQLFVWCYEAGIGEGVDITSGQFKVNGDPQWTWKWGDLQAKNAMDARLQYFIDYYMKNVGTTDELWTRIPAPLPIMVAGTSPTAAPHFTTLAAGDKVTVTTDTANDVNLMRVNSEVLPATVVLDLDQDGSMQHMQYQGVKDLEMILTNGGAGAAVKILEQSIAKVWGHSE